MFYVHPEPWKNYDPIWFAHIFSNGLVQPPDNQLFPLKHRTCRLDRSFIILSLEAGIFQTRIPVDGFFFFFRDIRWYGWPTVLQFLNMLLFERRFEKTNLRRVGKTGGKFENNILHQLDI